MRLFVRASIVCIGFILLCHIFPSLVYAELVSCTASVSPTSAPVNASQGFTFDIQNTDEGTNASWIRILRPSEDFSITAVSSGGTISFDDNQITIEVSLSPSESISVEVTANTGSTLVSGEVWEVLMSDDSSGESPIDCDGTLSANIIAATSTPTGTLTPTPTGASVTSTPTPTNSPTPTPTPIPDKTAPRVILRGTYSQRYQKVPAIAGEAFDAVGVTKLEYTTDGGQRWSAVPNVKNLGETTILFSFAPLLSVDGEFTVQFRASDAAGNKGTSTKETVFVDATGPVVVVETDFSHPYPQAPDIEGAFQDSGGIATAEYSLDGINWTVIDGLGLFDGLNTKFQFDLPIQFDDGSYEIHIRATDSVNNSTLNSPMTLVIDRLPPQVGPVLVTRESYMVPVGEDGITLLLAGQSYRMTVSAIGGPTYIEISTSESQTISLTSRKNVGVWQGDISFVAPGEYELVAKARDGAENVTERSVGHVRVLPSGTINARGQPHAGSQITVYAYDPVQTRYVPWDGGTYGVANTQYTDNEGRFFLWLPAGQYYLAVRTPGYQPLITDIFTVSRSVPVTSSLSLTPARSLSFGPITLPLPDFRVQTTTIAPEEELLKFAVGKEASSLVGSIFPDFSLVNTDGENVTQESLRGNSTIVSVVNTWLPSIAEHLHALEKISQEGMYNVVILAPHETRSKLKSFVSRGGYTIPFIADSDGATVPSLSVSRLPIYYVLDNSGTIEHVMSDPKVVLR